MPLPKTDATYNHAQVKGGAIKGLVVCNMQWLGSRALHIETGWLDINAPCVLGYFSGILLFKIANSRGKKHPEKNIGLIEKSHNLNSTTLFYRKRPYIKI